MIPEKQNDAKTNNETIIHNNFSNSLANASVRNKRLPTALKHPTKEPLTTSPRASTTPTASQSTPNSIVSKKSNIYSSSYNRKENSSCIKKIEV